MKKKKTRLSPPLVFVSPSHLVALRLRRVELTSPARSHLLTYENII